MSHVDEGLLHAYLDGAFPKANAQGEEIEAHLAVCVDCRVRLEDARALKDRAQVVLHHASPGEVRVPPFDSVLARRSHAAAATDRTRTSWLPPVKLAWAATIILAVGAGWMANEVLRRGQASEPFFAEPVSSPAERRGADAAASQAAVPESELRVVGPRDETEQANASRAAERDGTAAEVRSANRPQGEVPAAPPTSVAASSLEDRQAKAAERITVTGRRAAATDSPVEARGEAAAPEAQVPPSVAAAMTLVRNPNEILQAGLLARVAGEDESSQALVQFVNDYYTAQSGSSWREVSPVQARLVLGGQLAVIAGAEATSLEQAIVAARPLVRTRYQLPGGDTVELVQRAEPVANAAAARDVYRAADSLNAGVPLSGLAQRSDMFRGQSVLWLRRPALQLLLKSGVPLDSLQSLASRVR